MTGSAYSCIDAVKITSVYHCETCEGGSGAAPRDEQGTDLPQEVVNEWPLIHMVQRTAPAQYHLDGVPRALVPPSEAEKTGAAGGGDGSRGRVDQRLVQVQYQCFG